MKPGATTSPATFTVSRAAGTAVVTETMRPPLMPTARTASSFVSGSSTLPLTSTTSSGAELCASASCRESARTPNASNNRVRPVMETSVGRRFGGMTRTQRDKLEDMGILRLTVGIESPNRRGALRDLPDTMVDTGSEYTWVPRSVLEDLGVGVERIERFVTADGRIIAREMGYAIV